MSEEKSEERCFVIMPISDQIGYPEGHFTKVYEQIFKPAIEQAGYEAYRVDENVISDPIIGKIFEAIQECPMALCDLSSRNPNVLYELGLRQAYDKPVVLVQDEKTERIFDVSGINTLCYESARLYEDVIEAREKITQAIRETKQGKKNSIIKIVKAKTAEISTDSLSREDKIEIMLLGLISDVKDIKLRENTNRLINFSGNDCISDFDVGEPIYDVKKRVTGEVRNYPIPLKSGVTMREITKEMDEMQERYGAYFIWKRKGGVLEVVFDEGVPQKIMKMILSRIIEKIGI